MVQNFFRIIFTHMLKDNAYRHLIMKTLNIFCLSLEQQSKAPK